MTMTAEEDYKLTTQELLRRYNYENGVIERVDQLKGWHLAECELYKPGVYRGFISGWFNGVAHFNRFYAKQDIIRLAIELKYLSKPNGYTLP
jgi:hypothetical protein